MKRTLVAALVSCADDSLKNDAARFLEGLSCDELQFIAEFLGASILHSSEECGSPRDEFAGRIAEFQRARRRGAPMRTEDLEHKMILLIEYTCRSGLQDVVPIG